MARASRPRVAKKAAPSASLEVDSNSATDPNTGVKRNVEKLDSYEVPKGKKKRAPKVKKQLASKDDGTPYYQNVQQDKPEPIGAPVAWATKRQALCEALPYYKAYQSGPYSSNKKIFGLMCDQETDLRDFVDDQVLITRVGGGKVLGEDGKMVQGKDQKKSVMAEAFKQSRGLPIGVILGQGNTNSPAKLPHYYNVLDWFHITDIWADLIDNKTRWMVRLEKIDLNSQSWWAAATQTPKSLDTVTKVPELECSQCHETSKHVYTAGWTCLNQDCSKFFVFEEEPENAKFSYTAEFLAQRTSYDGIEPDSLAPPLLTSEALEAMDGVGYEVVCKRGIVCPECGCCSRRLLWDRWACENPTCNFEHIVPPKLVTAIDCLSNGSTRSMPAKFFKHGVTQSMSVVGAYTVSTYYMPDSANNTIGVVRHFKANSGINAEKDGPDSLFEDLQRDGHRMKRGPVRQPGSVGEICTSHWGRNYGAPYKFAVKQESTPFSDAPAVVLKTFKRLTWAGKLSVPETEEFRGFNELLTLGYFEDSKINYHDDGEQELGPTVVSISLGSPATMSWRPKAKSDVGTAGKGVKGLKEACLRIHLNHGDIMVMHGTGIQEHYEHEVTPYGLLRYGVTCRYIRPETLPVQDRQDSIAAGTIPAGFTYDYDGSIVPARKVVNAFEAITQHRARRSAAGLATSASESNLGHLSDSKMAKE